MGRRFLVAGWLLAAVACSAPPEVSFPTADGGVVFADVYGDADRTLILAHGGRFTKESWAEQAPVLQRAGFRVVAIDFRGRGRSGPARDEGYEHDVLAAVRWARQTGATSVAVVGASFGGWAAAAAVARAPGEIERVVLLAAGAEDPQELNGRTLFIVARDDTRGEGIPRLPEIRAAYEAAPEPKELVVLDGAAHAQFLFDSDQGDRLLREIERFLTAP